METGKEMFVLYAVEENVLHLQEQLTPAILSLHDSLQMYSSKQESLKKSHETYKVNKMAYDLFFVQYFMMYKKTQSTEVFRLIFHLKDRSFKSVRFITSGKWDKCNAAEMFFSSSCFQLFHLLLLFLKY